MGGERIKTRYISFFMILFILLISLNIVAANEDTNQSLSESDNHIDEAISVEDSNDLTDSSYDLENAISNCENGDEILIDPGTYKVHNIKITKNITLQGNGNPREIIIDGENKSSIFLIRSPDVHVTFKNLTFINGLSYNFGGAISIETGNVYVDNCIFANGTALNKTNAGAISNYGTKKNRGYLFVNNSLFINNHADHDGGAITTCYANSDIYNSVFINNSACRDGGAIRVSVFGYGNVQDCIFMFNHADEWGGAYYSWSGTSNIERCIFMNNTAGTNGGAVMVSGNINLEKSIIVNNEGGETGGSFYIQQPMYDTKTVINLHDNLITNNTSPYGKEIFIHWWDTHNLYTQFDDNDWGDEDPNDSSVIDPNKITSRSKVKSTIKSNLFGSLNVDLLNRYDDLLKDYFPDDSLTTLQSQFTKDDNADSNNQGSQSSPNADERPTKHESNDVADNPINNPANTNDNINTNITSQSEAVSQQNANAVGNSTSHGESNKAYELNEHESVAKQTSLDIRYFIAAAVLVFVLLIIGYKTNKRE